MEIYRGGRWRTEEDDISRTRYTVEDLNPYTRYTFRVAAHNAAGWGPASAEVAVTTRRAEPGQPHSLAAAATHDRVTLTWQAPTAGGRVTGYRVQRRVGSGRYQVAADTGTVTYFVDRDVSPRHDLQLCGTGAQLRGGGQPVRPRDGSHAGGAHHSGPAHGPARGAECREPAAVDLDSTQ